VRHAVSIFGSDDDLASRVAPFLKHGVEAGEVVIVVTDRRKRALLDEALGPAGASIEQIDRDSFYTRPEAAIASYDAQVRRLLRAGAPAVRLFGELPVCTTREEVDAWIVYEAILNRAFDRRPVSILCGYDEREQPGALIENAWLTHPHVVAEGREHNSHYREPGEVARLRTLPLDAPHGLRALDVDGDALGFRTLLAREMSDAGVAAAEAQNLLVAAGEVLANAYRHGGGIRRVRIGRVGTRFVCEISDRGPGIADPLVGYIPPGAYDPCGGGLWVARQLTRRLDLVSSPRGLTARLWVDADDGTAARPA